MFLMYIKALYTMSELENMQRVLNPYTIVRQRQLSTGITPLPGHRLPRFSARVTVQIVSETFKKMHDIYIKWVAARGSNDLLDIELYKELDTLLWQTFAHAFTPARINLADFEFDLGNDNSQRVIAKSTAGIQIACTFCQGNKLRVEVAESPEFLYGFSV